MSSQLPVVSGSPEPAEKHAEGIRGGSCAVVTAEQNVPPPTRHRGCPFRLRPLEAHHPHNALPRDALLRVLPSARRPPSRRHPPLGAVLQRLLPPTIATVRSGSVCLVARRTTSRPRGSVTPRREKLQRWRRSGAEKPTCGGKVRGGGLGEEERSRGLVGDWENYPLQPSQYR